MPLRPSESLRWEGEPNEPVQTERCGWASWVPCVLVLLLIACKINGPIFSTPPIAIVSVLIAPRAATLGPMKVGDTVSVFTQASAANGDFVPVPTAVTWASSRPDFVQLQPTAARDHRIAQAVGVGTTTISVTMSGVTGQATLTIAP
jgi:hypothetical protein